MKFASVASGCERWMAGVTVPRHRHATAYAAIVLAGGYEESGNRGRFRVGPGDVLFHGAFDCHLDRFGAVGARIFNLVMPNVIEPRLTVAHLPDADRIVRTAERDPCVAAETLLAEAASIHNASLDWQDVLAAELAEAKTVLLGAWASRYGLAAETVSRGFEKLFGVPPRVYRAELRARRALARVAGGVESLAEIAADTGFADQAHMTRAIVALTGAPPTTWRRSNGFKTADR